MQISNHDGVMFRPCTGCPPSTGRNNSTRRELFLIQFCDRIDRSHFSKRSSQFLTSLTSLQCVYFSHRISNVFGNVRVIRSFFFSPLLFFFSEKDLLFSVKMTRCNWRRRTKRNTRYISVTNALPVITNNLSGTVYGASKSCVRVCVCVWVRDTGLSAENVIPPEAGRMEACTRVPLATVSAKRDCRGFIAPFTM